MPSAATTANAFSTLPSVKLMIAPAACACTPIACEESKLTKRVIPSACTTAFMFRALRCVKLHKAPAALFCASSLGDESKITNALMPPNSAIASWFVVFLYAKFQSKPAISACASLVPTVNNLTSKEMHPELMINPQISESMAMVRKRPAVSACRLPVLTLSKACKEAIPPTSTIALQQASLSHANWPNASTCASGKSQPAAASSCGWASLAYIVSESVRNLIPPMLDSIIKAAANSRAT
mmetsp:Transcript_46504/g.118044  ORF Transcript_46504/g.118044 Transcript_46504/m.118044 type:complete len:240 (+) Transcript_46504:145-864(+)